MGLFRDRFVFSGRDKPYASGMMTDRCVYLAVAAATDLRIQKVYLALFVFLFENLNPLRCGF
jgi:hypothetical protein